jgi:hypothetical protein
MVAWARFCIGVDRTAEAIGTISATSRNATGIVRTIRSVRRIVSFTSV